MLSSRRKKASTKDYLLAGASVSPWLVALSSVATLSSGFMFVGMVGFTYETGLSALWMLVGWALGDWVAWRWLYARVKQLASERHAVSALALIRPRKHAGERQYLVRVAAVLTVVYLSIYAAAQLKAGSTALESMFHVPSATGAIIGAVIVVIYCFSGGIRASIWTDAAQSILMLGAMLVLVVKAVITLGGPSGLMQSLAAIDPKLTSLIPTSSKTFGFFPYVLSMTLGGFGVIGAPHVVVRAMCVSHADEIKRARRYYFTWLLPFYAMTVIVGLCARVLLPGLQHGVTAASPEQALSLLSLELLPAIPVGLMLSGLFSATMSTADSQLIACTSAVTQDIFPRWKNSYRISKASTLTVTMAALAVAIFAPKTVYSLVLDAWGVMSSTIGPLMLFGILRVKFSQAAGLATMAVGFVVANLWAGSTFANNLYVNLPGMVAAVITFGIARKLLPDRPHTSQDALPNG